MVPGSKHAYNELLLYIIIYNFNFSRYNNIEPFVYKLHKSIYYDKLHISIFNKFYIIL